MSILVLCFGILWPQFQKWCLAFSGLFFAWLTSSDFNYFPWFIWYFWTHHVHKNQFYTSKFGKKILFCTKIAGYGHKMAKKWPLSNWTKVPLVGTLNLCQEMPDIMQKDLGQTGQPFWRKQSKCGQNWVFFNLIFLFTKSMSWIKRLNWLLFHLLYFLPDRLQQFTISHSLKV